MNDFLLYTCSILSWIKRCWWTLCLPAVFFFFNFISGNGHGYILQCIAAQTARLLTLTYWTMTLVARGDWPIICTPMSLVGHPCIQSSDRGLFFHLNDPPQPAQGLCWKADYHSVSLHSSRHKAFGLKMRVFICTRGAKSREVQNKQPVQIHKGGMFYFRFAWGTGEKFHLVEM